MQLTLPLVQIPPHIKSNLPFSKGMHEDMLGTKPFLIISQTACPEYIPLIGQALNSQKL